MDIHGIKSGCADAMKRYRTEVGDRGQYCFRRGSHGGPWGISAETRRSEGRSRVAVRVTQCRRRAGAEPWGGASLARYLQVTACGFLFPEQSEQGGVGRR